LREKNREDTGINRVLGPKDYEGSSGSVGKEDTRKGELKNGKGKLELPTVPSNSKISSRREESAEGGGGTDREQRRKTEEKSYPKILSRTILAQVRGIFQILCQAGGRILS